MGIANDPFDAKVIRAAYDTVADDYASAFADDLRELPVDVETLVAALSHMEPGGSVLDLGCGPGQVGAFLAGCGAPVIGVDLAPRMVALAARRNKVIPYLCADMRALPLRTATLNGVVAYYSVQHIGRSELPGVLGELRRVLADAGLLVVATHLGEGEAIFDEFLGHKIETAGGNFYEREELLGALTNSGFEIESVRERGPLEHEHQSQRIYVIARKQTSPAN